MITLTLWCHVVLVTAGNQGTPSELGLLELAIVGIALANRIYYYNAFSVDGQVCGEAECGPSG